MSDERVESRPVSPKSSGTDDTAPTVDWPKANHQLADHIEEFQLFPDRTGAPLTEDFDYDGWMQWVGELYRTPVDRNDLHGRGRKYIQTEDAKIVYRFGILQEDLDPETKHKLGLLAETMSQSVDTFGFVGTVLEAGIIDQLPPAVLNNIFSNAIELLEDVRDVQICLLYRGKGDGLHGQRQLWEFDQFSSFVAQTPSDKKHTLVEKILRRIESSSKPDYRQDSRYAKDFSPSQTLNRFLARMVLQEIGRDRKSDLLPVILEGAAEKDILLYRFWDHLLYELRGNYPAGLAETFSAYLHSSLDAAEQFDTWQLVNINFFDMFRLAIRGNVLSVDQRYAFLDKLTAKYGKQLIVENLFDGNHERYDQFIAHRPGKN